MTLISKNSLVVCKVSLNYRITFLTYNSIQDKLEAFLKGFRSTLKLNIIGVFTPEELDFLISGMNKIDLNDWKFHTIYKGLFNENHPVKCK
jgi:hypothetical protein